LTYGTLGSRILYFNIASYGYKYKFYGVWSFSDANVIAHGLGYNGKDKHGSSLWDRVISIYVVELEMAATPVKMMGYWNHQISVWLNRYVSARLMTKGQKSGLFVTGATLMVSAFWHGFYPFYYVMFFFSAIFVELAKDIYRIRILFPLPGPVCQFIGCMGSHFVMNYLSCVMASLTFERGLLFGQGTNYLIFILLPVSCILLKLSGLIKMAKKIELKQKEKAVGESKKDK